MRLVDENFKAPRKRSNKSERIEELETALENNRERADILSDKFDTLREETEHLVEPMSDEESLALDLLRDLLYSWERVEIGVISENDECVNILNKLKELKGYL